MWAWTIASAASLALAGTAAQPVPERGWDDLLGHRHVRTEWQAHKAVVLLFVATECPASNSYAPEYGRLARRCADCGIGLYGVHCDPNLSAAAAADHARAYRLTFPILLDPEQALARLAGARVTPEAVLLSPQGDVLYRGRIDDRYSLDGRRRDVPRTKDLEAAIDAVLAGRPPPVPETRAFGCPLPRLRGNPTVSQENR